jgi:hypothetical protein
MLQRVVEKRSGDRPPWVAVSGVTGGDHLIYVILRQAKKLRSLMGGRGPQDRGPLFTHLSTLKGEAFGGRLSIILLRNLRAEVLKNVMKSGESESRIRKAGRPGGPSLPFVE